MELQETLPKKQKSVSYSQFSLFLQCPRRWKLDYVDGLKKYEQNINTIFGSAFHRTVQNYLQVAYTVSAKEADLIDLAAYLQKELQDEYKNALSKNGGVHFTTPEELREFYADGVAILNYFKRKRVTYFPMKHHELVGIEIPLSIQLPKNLMFTGFIDLVLRNTKTGKILIKDFKTATIGWTAKHKSDVTKTAQLILYKQFYAEQFGVSVDDVEIEYVIVRRKILEEAAFPPKRVQLFTPASGKPTRNKVLREFDNFVASVFNNDGSYITDKQHVAITNQYCKYCPYFKDESRCPSSERISKDG